VRANRPYHHGNLRQVILEASVALIREVGPKGFTIREVARRASVSHNAPYRHFHDKDELIAAIVAEGFERLTAAMKKSAASGPSGADRLKLCGRAYVEFALNWPGHFMVMFDLAPTSEDCSRPGKVGESAFQTLVGFIVESQIEETFPAGDPYPLALMAWSLVHGIAKLAISGQMPLTSEAVLEFTWQAGEALVRGMGEERIQNPESRL
jgi:AcrR family transcriptional regulator